MLALAQTYARVYSNVCSPWPKMKTLSRLWCAMTVAAHLRHTYGIVSGNIAVNICTDNQQVNLYNGYDGIVFDVSYLCRDIGAPIRSSEQTCRWVSEMRIKFVDYLDM